MYMRCEYKKFMKTTRLGPDHHLPVVPSGQRQAGLAAKSGLRYVQVPQFVIPHPPLHWRCQLIIIVAPLRAAGPPSYPRPLLLSNLFPALPPCPYTMPSPVHSSPLRAACEKRACQAPAQPPRGAQVRDNGRKTRPGGLAPSVTRISPVASPVPSPQAPLGAMHSGLCLEGGLPWLSAGGAP